MGLLFLISNFLREGIGLLKKIPSQRYWHLGCWHINNQTFQGERRKSCFLNKNWTSVSQLFFIYFLDLHLCALTPEHGQKLKKANKRVSNEYNHPKEVRWFSSEVLTLIVGGSAMTKTPLSNCSKDSIKRHLYSEIKKKIYLL